MTDWLVLFALPDAARLTAASLALLAVALLLLGGIVVEREWRSSRGRRLMDRIVREAAGSDAAPQSEGPGSRLDGRSQVGLPAHLLRTRLGRQLVADEDRDLIEQCGWPTVPAQLIMSATRVALVIVLPLAALLLSRIGVLPGRLPVVLTVAFVLGFMAPKWLLARFANARRARVAQELPLFVDLLRLLQGVGLSLDQSLQVMANDFTGPLPVLAAELAIANRHYTQGRSREHSLQRLAALHRNDHLAGLVELLVTVDRHGGAVQEPLARFSERLRENRRHELKGRIGRITVKMTGVMVITLLPALVIITAGPGFLAITRSLGSTISR
jgi:tight adherence protein C